MKCCQYTQKAVSSAAWILQEGALSGKVEMKADDCSNLVQIIYACDLIHS